ncbi:MAG: (deoxy)nucleoside triphosphate pyrophosphohydrolase [Proteobacteria bacterium]|nr:(deoxy)nucleoside triphosphate pyrophosphohydrolase [Pseudomonadota bacterium]
MIEVVCALIQRDRKLLVAKRAVGQSMAGKWEFPGGKLRAGETPRKAIVREIMEELGCTIEVRSALPVNEHHYCDFSIRLIPFVCRLTAGEPEALEHEEINWASLAQLRNFDWTAADIPILDTYLREVSRP